MGKLELHSLHEQKQAWSALIFPGTPGIFSEPTARMYPSLKTLAVGYLMEGERGRLQSFACPQGLWLPAAQL